MNNLILFFGIFFIFGSSGSLFAQNVPGVPNGAVANNSRDDYDNGIRIRSIELERIRNESHRSALAAKAVENRNINYSQIKKDFEFVQKLQNEIVKTYVTGKQINYKRIGTLASKLNECAARLDENLALSTEKQPEKKAKKHSAPEDVSDIIVILDKSIGKFVVSPIFKNLLILETNDAEKAKFDLQSIIYLSDLLSQKSENHK